MPNLAGIEATRCILALADGWARPDQAPPGGAETKVLMPTTFDLDEYV